MSTPFREKAKVLWPLGWAGQLGHWITVAALHGGLFTRPQVSAYLRISRAHSYRVIRKMKGARIVAEETIEDRSVCRITRSQIYRALGLGPRRGRLPRRRHHAMRRLLTLDFVIDHRDLPWISTGAEMVSAFEALGIARDLLPRRRFRLATSGPSVRYFPDDLPVALDGDRARFLFVDPGLRTGEPLQRWGKAHLDLWERLRGKGRSVEILAAVRSVRDLRRARNTLESWSRPTRPRGCGEEGPVTREIERIERAIIEGDAAALKAYGELQSALRRLTALRERRRLIRTSRVVIDGYEIWRSTRLPAEPM
ncbi:MAG: hypothetical protein OYK82_12930 [Gammaproteobacteria bacterium]|nr:hypothetical protein [Gammaproteobacteria bacterium]